MDATSVIGDEELPSYHPCVGTGESDQDLRERVQQVGSWRHRIDLGGLVTPGSEDTTAEWQRLRVPSPEGKRVLDIGCSDGYYSFRCESLGASEVVAIDDESSFLAPTNGFRLAADRLGSKTTYMVRDVETMSAEQDGQFDIVLFINVLYHLPNPVLALRRIADVTRPGGTLVLKTYYRTDFRVWLRGKCYGFDLERRPKWWYFPGSELGGDPTNWWAPNRSGLEALLQSTGWTNVHQITTWRDRLYYQAVRA
jgi:tRNA (mo5U34)-methyltransferase